MMQKCQNKNITPAIRGPRAADVAYWIGKYSADETFDIGEDTGSPVSADYAAPNRFTGTIKKIVINSQPAKLSAVDQQKLQDMARKARLKVE